MSGDCVMSAEGSSGEPRIGESQAQMVRGILQPRQILVPQTKLDHQSLEAQGCSRILV